ncbi:DUF2795 domain-containing protein [Pseudonocardia sp.]|uniref:DUF2795 domain-containing protein n=1 Tax=Pseudonocardia sp. TaxID=60912 RepID=UPI00261056EF|nr:DUF2795 domain-containing protein [Pseudonocardia sp.]MCW2718381.1 hypothetical protein [Pseudonocardia sp.]MDT7615913.1 hypothetical protein [Pseudonocardiales bacterium]
MFRSNPRADVARLSQVLDGVGFPAAKWQLIMHAEQYGADAATRSDVWSLPSGTYPALVDVLAALGLVANPAQRPTRYQSQPAAPAAARDLPSR